MRCYMASNVHPVKIMRRHRYTASLAATLLGLLSGGCGSLINDYEGDCENVYELQFVYDYNLKWADAFAAEVDAVTLHVIDPENGSVVWSRTESGEALAQDGYRIRLDLEPGHYEFVAWCGEGAHDGGKSFAVHTQHTATPGETMRHHLGCTMQRNLHPETGKKVVNPENGLNHLFHGYAEDTLPEGEGLKYTVRLPLVKNTNSLKIVLQSLSGKEINTDDYDFALTDSNGLMDWDNSILDDEELTYRAWAVSGGSAEILDPNFDGYGEQTKAKVRGITVASAVVADMTVGRLMENAKPVLSVKDKNKGKVLFRIPVNDYALMVKGNYKQPMTDQEYLDRQDNYNMTFFLNEKGEWINTFIHINKWKVVLNEGKVN